MGVPHFEVTLQAVHFSLQIELGGLKKKNKLKIPEAEGNFNILSITTMQKAVKRIVMIYSVITVCLAICLYYSSESSPPPRGCRHFYPGSGEN